MKKIYLIGLIVAVLVLVGLKWGYSRINTGSSELSWNANTESNLAGYKIYYVTSSRKDACPGNKKGGYENVIDTGKKTKYTIENLKWFTKYYYSTTSYNASGQESCFSEEVSKRVK
jgi:hypothetical protein